MFDPSRANMRGMNPLDDDSGVCGVCGSSGTDEKQGAPAKMREYFGWYLFSWGNAWIRRIRDFYLVFTSMFAWMNL